MWQKITQSVVMCQNLLVNMHKKLHRNLKISRFEQLKLKNRARTAWVLGTARNKMKRILQVITGYQKQLNDKVTNISHNNNSVKPGFHPNAITCVACVWMETELNASACVGKQPIMVATASTEHPIGCKRLARFPSKRNARNASDCVWMETGL